MKRIFRAPFLVGFAILTLLAWYFIAWPADQPRSLFYHASAIESLTFSSDGRLFAAASRDGVIAVRDASGNLVVSLGVEGVTALAFVGQEHILLCGKKDGTISVVDVAKKKVVQKYDKALAGEISFLAVSPSEKYLGAVCVTGDVSVFQLEGVSLSKTHTLPAKTWCFKRSICFHPSDNVLVAGGSDISFWDPETGKRLRAIDNDGMITSIALNASGTLLATGDLLARITVWDYESGKKITSLVGHKSPVRDLAFSPKGDIVSLGWRCSWVASREIKIWTAADPRDPISFPSPREGGAALWICPDGSIVAIGGQDGSIGFWPLTQ